MEITESSRMNTLLDSLINDGASTSADHEKRKADVQADFPPTKRINSEPERVLYKLAVVVSHCR